VLKALRALNGLVGAVLMLVVGAYRLVVSPLITAIFGPACRFEPTCSVYAQECVRHYGPVRGSWRALRRICRCHPFHPGGYDPVISEARGIDG
jgi:putative membrane protein insertion efficiency factor